MNKERSSATHPSALSISKPQDSFVDNYYQSRGEPFGWRGRYINGADENTELADAIHYDPVNRARPDIITNKAEVVRNIGSAAGRYYAKRVNKETRPKPWDQAESTRKYGDRYGRW